MSSNGTGSGRHFSTSPKGGAFPTGARHSTSASDTTDFGLGAFPGPGVSSPSDTLANLAVDAPNGSHATPSASFEPVAARKASPSDTDVFLAVAAQPASAQEPLAPASSPISAHARKSAQTAAPAAQTGKAGPVNPLVAARNSGPSVTSSSGGGAQAGLFPIQEVEGAASKGFDTSFGEKGSKKAVVIVALIVVLVALAFVGAFFGLRYKDTADARSKINEAIDLLRTTDDIIVPLDSAIASEISSGAASDVLSDLMLQTTSTSSNLSSADQLASEAGKSRDILEDSDGDAIDAISSSVSARRAMLEVGRMLLSVDTSTKNALESLNMAYGCIADANAFLESASNEYAAYTSGADGTTSTGDPWYITQLEQQALDSITTAQNWVASAKGAFSSADLSALDTYLANRANEISLLMQYDSAVIMNGTTEGEADDLKPEYLAATEASAAAAQSVPATAAELLVSGYASATAAQREAYVEARAKCVSADTVLNGYLGISNPSKEMGVANDGAALTDASTAAADASADASATQEAATADAAEEAGQAEATDAAAEEQAAA